MSRRARRSLFLTSLLLLVVFSSHAVFIDHGHPPFLGEGISAVLHGSERKTWIVLVLLALLFGFSVARKLQKGDAAHKPPFFITQWDTCVFLNLFDSIRTALRAGIVHPKICE
jgi:hypothetical protein